VEAPQTTAASVGDLEVLIGSFRRHLKAANLSPRTIAGYCDSAELFHRFLVERGMPTTVVAIAREHVEAFI
jgi:hypothetical protein